MNPEPTDNPEIDLHPESNPAPKSKRLLLKLFLVFLVFLVILAFLSFVGIQNLNKPPETFPINQIVTIEEGTSVKEITALLEEAGVVKSKDLLYYSLILFHEPTSLKASNYRFDQPITTVEVATRLTEGDFDTDLISFTHFEGERASSVARRAALKLSDFNPERFVTNAELNEGKLFPETYFIPLSFTDTDLLKLMLDTFSEKISPYLGEISNHPLSLDEVIVLASIIEREANTKESMKLVSSVLQNRLEIEMALQADASIEYVLNKPLSELTPDDLETDSPYNTYLYRGLPPTPIGNPGIDSIEAVLRPTPTDYFYYLTDSSGTFHFAETYNQHLRNIEIYLR
jgi:UPF0755 protein